MTSRKLLYVDDNRSLASFSAMNLEDAISDLDVRVAHDCAEARTLAAEYSPEVLVTDRLLPDGNGLDLRRELVAGSPGLQCILVCATPPQEAEGFLQILCKPFSGEDLVEAVQQALERGRPIGEVSTGTSERQREGAAGRLDRHQALNRLSSILAKLRAFDMELRDEADDPKEVRRLVDEYVEPLVQKVHEVADMIRKK